MSTQELRKCGICGEHVLWQTNNGIGWHPIQYHDCKPVPGAWLEQARRERDEARKERGEASAAHASAAATNRRYNAKLLEADKRLAQAVALLREARDYVEQVVQENAANWGERLMHKQEPAIECLRMIDAFLSGQPAPAKVAVDDAMVERALSKWAEREVIQPSVAALRTAMRAALVAALEGVK